MTNGDYEQRGGAWIHPDARIGDDVVIEPGVVIAADVVVGDGCWIGANAVLYGPTVLGARNRIFPAAVLGGPPQDKGYAGEPTRLEVGDDNVFREGTSVSRGTVKGDGVTRVGNDNYLMAGAHVGHDCRVGDHVVLANSVLIGGHCHVHDSVYMAGRVSIVPFTTVGRFAFITGLSGTTMDVEPFLAHTGVPARPRSVNVVGLRRGGLPNSTIKALMGAYKLLFTKSSKGGDDIVGIREELERRDMLCGEVAELLLFMQRSREGEHGRMLQGDQPAGVDEPADDEPTGFAPRWTDGKDRR